jgi:hypothetical protein
MAIEPRDLIERLGDAATSPELMAIVRDFNLTDIQDDPPFRQYVGSKNLGISLLFNEGQLLDVQFFVKATKSYQAFALSLPYGLARDMSQDDVHKFLGVPSKHDPTYSRYLLEGQRVKLTIEYDKSGLIRYISTSTTKACS